MLRILSALFAIIYGISAQLAYGATCKDYKTCREAVINWCAGYHPRANGDGDGIPCENVCKSLDRVNEIKRKIGCKK